MTAREERPADLGVAPLTPEERRAGLRRLAVAGAVVLGLTLLVGLVFVILGADLVSGLGAGFGLVGIVMVIAGVIAFTRTGSVRRSHGQLRWASDVERKEAERLAFTLLGAGIVFSIVSLAVS